MKMLLPRLDTSKCIVILTVVISAAATRLGPLSGRAPPTLPPPPPIQVHVPNDDPTLLCAYQDDAQWVRHPLNCSVFFICDKKEARAMPPCSHNHVFSMLAKLCVPPNSGLDDCQENSIFEGQEFPGGPMGKPAVAVTSPTTVTIQITPEPTPGPTIHPDRQPTIIKSIMGDETSHEACNPNGPTLQPHPDNCAWYYNCTVRPDTYIFKFYETFTMECPYPQLFSYKSLKCEDFANVECGLRQEPRSPCEYRANQCGKTGHCKPCWVRYGSCLGRVDGPNSWPDFEWKPFFVECYHERTIYQGECDRATVFSPLSRACVSPYTVPRARGGWWPECGGRRDGLYPDEHGRCDFYYECKEGDFQDYMRCPEDLLFNPLNGKCQHSGFVPFPCGEATIPNICDTKPNGIFLDIYGRCSHYFECKNNELLGMSLCPAGVFNPLRGDCDSSGSVVQPCGQLKNPCKGKENGYYADTGTHCLRYYLCERELTIAAFTCRDGTIFNEVAGRCMDIAMSPPPCGLAPDCRNSSDGFYPALHRGSQYYAECRHARFTGYKKCTIMQGGLIFDYTKRRCDFPQNVCTPVGTRSDDCDDGELESSGEMPPLLDRLA